MNILRPNTKPSRTVRKLTDFMREDLPEAQTQAMPCALSKTDCVKCHGAGYVIVDGGATARADMCSCATGCQRCYGRFRIVEEGCSRVYHDPSPDRVSTIVNQARIPGRYANADFASFENLSGNGRHIVEQVQTWVNQYQPQHAQGILMSGGVGVGKTYLLAASAKAIAARGFSVRFVDFFELLAELKAGYAADRSDLSVISPLLDVDVLIIDELGKGRNSDWELTILDQLVMGRYNQKKAIIASTNYQLKGGASTAQAYNVDLERDLHSRNSTFNPDAYGSLESRVGIRIFSRLAEMTRFVELTGQDMRRLRRS